MGVRGSEARALGRFRGRETLIEGNCPIPHPETTTLSQGDRLSAPLEVRPVEGQLSGPASKQTTLGPTDLAHDLDDDRVSPPGPLGQAP